MYVFDTLEEAGVKEVDVLFLLVSQKNNNDLPC